jgi:hypothetical protein
MRYYYYAIPMPDGRWELRSSLASKPFLHPNKEMALLTATVNCRRHWEETGTPCGVRIQMPDGQWKDEIVFGDPENHTQPPPDEPGGAVPGQSV